MSEATATGHVASAHPDFQPEEKRVIFASSLGTVFEWYDFYLYATLAPFFAALFFPKGNDTAALLSSFATYAAGFLVRPFGALVFGRVGDIVGRSTPFCDDYSHGRCHFCGGPVAYIPKRLDGRRRSCWCCCDCCKASRWAGDMAAPRPAWQSTPRRADVVTIRAGFRPPPRLASFWR